MGSTSYRFKGTEQFRSSTKKDRKFSCAIQMVNDTYFEGEMSRGGKSRHISGYVLNDGSKERIIIAKLAKKDNHTVKRIYYLEKMSGNNGDYEGMVYVPAEGMEKTFDAEEFSKKVREGNGDRLARVEGTLEASVLAESA